MLARILKRNALFDDALRNLAKLEPLRSQLQDALHNILLRVTIIKTIRGQDQQVILRSQRPCLSFRIWDDKLLKLEISKGSADAKFALDAIVKDDSIVALNAHLLVGAIWRVLFVQLGPAAVLAN